MRLQGLGCVCDSPNGDAETSKLFPFRNYVSWFTAKSDTCSLYLDTLPPQQHPLHDVEFPQESGNLVISYLDFEALAVESAISNYGDAGALRIPKHANPTRPRCLRSRVSIWVAARTLPPRCNSPPFLISTFPFKEIQRHKPRSLQRLEIHDSTRCCRCCCTFPLYIPNPAVPDKLAGR